MGFNNPGRGAAQPGKAAQGKAPKYGTTSSNHEQTAASISSVPDGLLAETVDLVTMSGDLISFTRTSDGGAWCIYVKSGPDGYKYYPHSTEELTDVLTTLARGARG